MEEATFCTKTLTNVFNIKIVTSRSLGCFNKSAIIFLFVFELWLYVLTRVEDREKNADSEEEKKPDAAMRMIRSGLKKIISIN